MGFLMFTGLKLMLTMQQHHKLTELTELSQKKMDLLRYSSILSQNNGYIPLHNLAEVPLSMMGQADALNGRFGLFYQDQLARSEGAQSALSADPAAIQKFMYDLEQRTKEMWQRNAAKTISADEQQIDMKIKQIETELKSIDGRLAAAEQAEDKFIQKSAPKFGSGMQA